MLFISAYDVFSDEMYCCMIKQIFHSNRYRGGYQLAAMSIL
jgi:hypothetical protein